tara:strand:+ start:1669 stop:2130 length:462 start_codon:yes stop_codon:yes gene_type:complete
VKLEQATQALRADKIIGWREHVGLPDLGIALLQAKIDTGARTSALHAIDLQTFDKEGECWISFHVPHRGRHKDQRQSAKILDEREIRNTSGVPEMRYVIATKLALGRRRWRIEVSLADREQMKFDLILGRTAIRRHNMLVAPGKSFLVGLPKT